MDGTLADTESLGHRPAYNRAFRKLGLDFRWGPKLYRKLLKKTGGQERLLHYLKRYQPELGEHAAAAQADPGLWTRTVHELKSRYFRRMVRRGRVPLRPGVARLMLEAHAAGLRIGIVTSASRASVKPMLRHGLGPKLKACVDVLVCGDDVSRKKPHPDLYRLALERLAVPASACLAIEDSASGLASALAAGIATLITTNSNTAHEDFAGAALVLDSLGEPAAPLAALAEGWVTVAALRRLHAQASPDSGTRAA